VKQEMDEKGLVGLSVGLVKDGEVILTRGWGWADRDKKIAVSDDTVYVWASCSKTLTAVVAMQLWAEGKLDLDKDVREYVPGWPIKQWDGKDVVLTPRLLLCHQAGLRHSPPNLGPPAGPPSGLPAANDPASQPPAEHPFKDVANCIAPFAHAPLQNKPGAAFSYSNCGFVLLGAAEQGAAGKPYADLVRERIAQPLGLTTLRPHASWDPAPRLSRGYAPGGKRESNLPSSDVRYGLPAGFWSSTIADFAKYAAGLMGDKLLDQKMRDIMWKHQTTSDGKPTPAGLGIFVGGQGKGRLTLNHSGGSPVTSTYMVLQLGEKPGHGYAAVVMCNTAGAKLGKLGNELVEMIGGGAAGAVEGQGEEGGK
jgi:CubicO group peptidase (beta-lactamase class C family)